MKDIEHTLDRKLVPVRRIGAAAIGVALLLTGCEGESSSPSNDTAAATSQSERVTSPPQRSIPEPPTSAQRTDGPTHRAGLPTDRGGHAHTNHLINETSPYLLQHAHNPVNWYPWGDEAFERAKAENKPIFLSVGYSTCYWCHVMERESFEQEDVAEILNAHFIAIKLDREERLGATPNRHAWLARQARHKRHIPRRSQRRHPLRPSRHGLLSLGRSGARASEPRSQAA